MHMLMIVNLRKGHKNASSLVVCLGGKAIDYGMLSLVLRNLKSKEMLPLMKGYAHSRKESIAIDKNHGV